MPYGFPHRRIEQARAFPEVVAGRARSIETRRSFWRNAADGLPRPIRVVGYPPADDALDLPELRAASRGVGPAGHGDGRPPLADPAAWGRSRPGTVSELSGKTVRILGTFELGVDYQSDGTLVMSDSTLADIFPDRRGASAGDDDVTIGLLAGPAGVDLDRLRARIEAALPPDVRVLTKDGLIAKEQGFWDHVAPIGTVFSIGVVMGFIVGLAICYQVLFADISERLAEFATLKAMGYSERAAVRDRRDPGRVPGAARLRGRAGRQPAAIRRRPPATGLPMDLRPHDAAGILGLTVLMCVASGCLAARRLASADPAQLFR